MRHLEKRVEQLERAVNKPLPENIVQHPGESDQEFIIRLLDVGMTLEQLAVASYECDD